MDDKEGKYKVIDGLFLEMKKDGFNLLDFFSYSANQMLLSASVEDMEYKMCEQLIGYLNSITETAKDGKILLPEIRTGLELINGGKE